MPATSAAAGNERGRALFSARRAAAMLLLGICNPAGEEATYNGLYYKQDELQTMVADGRLRDVPVKQEHAGGDVGRVVSSFVREDGALQCVMEVDDSTVEGSIAVCSRLARARAARVACIKSRHRLSAQRNKQAGLVRDGIAADLSLGYTVDVQHTAGRAALQAGAKQVLEISLVRRGARRGCHVLAYQETGRPTVYKGAAPAAADSEWEHFDMR